MSKSHVINGPEREHMLQMSRQRQRLHYGRTQLWNCDAAFCLKGRQKV